MYPEGFTNLLHMDYFWPFLIFKERNFDLVEAGLNPGLLCENFPLYHLSYTFVWRNLVCGVILQWTKVGVKLLNAFGFYQLYLYIIYMSNSHLWNSQGSSIKVGSCEKCCNLSNLTFYKKNNPFLIWSSSFFQEILS